MIRIDSDFITRTLQQLVRIPSVNPSLDSRGSGEAEIAKYTAGVMEEVGLEVRTHEPEPGRVSVVGRLRGGGGGRSLMLNAHTDTVGVEGMREPFSGDLRDGKVWGRGAYDMKGSLAACIGAAQALTDADVPLAGDLLIAAVADEEHASLGTSDLLRYYTVDGAIVTEPTGLDLCLAHKGFVWLEVETHGRAAHGSRPDLGIDANLRMGRVLAGLEELDRELQRRPPHPLLGSPSLHAATLHGGTGLSTYADRCTLGIERRTVPGEREDEVAGEIQRILDRLSDQDPTFRASAKMLLVRDPFEVSPDAAVVRVLQQSATAALGTSPARIGETPWMDSALLAAAGVETVVFGPTGAGAHAAEEWVDVDSVVRLAQVLAETAVGYCAVSPDA